jgi:hypothetical protein
MTQQGFDRDAFQQQVLEDVKMMIQVEEQTQGSSTAIKNIEIEDPLRFDGWLMQAEPSKSGKHVKRYSSFSFRWIYLISLLVVLGVIFHRLIFTFQPKPPSLSEILLDIFRIFIFILNLIFIVSICVFIASVIISGLIELSTRLVRKLKQSKARKKEAQAKQRLELVLTQAQEITQRPDFRSLVCPVLQSVTNDVFEYSKILTPILVGAVLAKTIIMPLDTLLFAAISIVVSKSGVSAMCASYPGKK